MSRWQEISYDGGNLQPQAVELEEAVLGAVMLQDESYHQVADLLHPEAFYKEQNGRICSAIIGLKNRGEVVDILTVTQELKRMGVYQEVGGAYYVSSLTNRVAGAGNIESHMRIVLQAYVKREAILHANKLISEAYDPTIDFTDIIGKWEAGLTNLLDRVMVRKAQDVGQLLGKLLEYNTNLTSSTTAFIGVPCGINKIDRFTGGWRKSDLIILAARPGMGKTAKAIGAAVKAALAGRPTLVFSLEQSSLQLFQRACSQVTHIPLEMFIRSGMDRDTLSTLHRDIAELVKAPLYIDDTGGLQLNELRTKARRAKREQKIEFIVVDYLQLLSIEGWKGNREQEVSKISRALKALAKELDIPIMALSQLSRESENRPGTSKIPQLSDLRDSGAIEQDADMVMFIYRPEYYGLTQDENNESTNGVAIIIIAKNRHGALERLKIKWKAECVLFHDWDAAITGPTYEQKLQKLKNNTEFLGVKTDKDDLPF